MTMAAANAIPRCLARCLACPPTVSDQSIRRVGLRRPKFEYGNGADSGSLACVLGKA
jgi:hypothetical protein